MRQELTRQLKGDEDTKPCVYPDSEGYWTIGTGRLVDSRFPGAGLRPVEMSFMLNNDIDDRIDALTRALPWFQDLDDVRKGVLLNMSFQLGVPKLMKFKQTLELVRAGQYAAASKAMLDSLWAQQTANRAARLSKQMAVGTWQFAPGA